MTGDDAESTERTTGNGPGEEDDEMRATGGTFRTFVVAVLVMLGLLAAMSPGTSAAQGNSGAAHACQKDGWQTLVREDGSSFANQGECVRYAAQGGTVAAPDNRGISLTWSYATQHFGFSQYEICYAHVTLTNFPAGDHTIRLTVNSGVAGVPDGSIAITVPVGTDGTGTADTTRAYGPNVFGAWFASTEPGDDNIGAWQAVVTATTADGLATTSNASCQRPS